MANPKPWNGEALRSLRRYHGWSAQRLADECARAGVPSLTRGTIAKIECGARQDITLDEAATLSGVFGITIDDFWRLGCP
jgi:transcriptional regulator with XRE-family HTH domain